MNNSTYSCSYVEVLEILKTIPSEEYKKIPEEKIRFCENNKDKDYIYFYNECNTVISRKAKTILINLYKNYIASEDEKCKIEEILKLNDIKLEREKQNRYNSNALFRNKVKTENNYLIEVNEKSKWYTKIYNFIKGLFSKK